MKKLLSLTLVAIMMVAALAGCGTPAKQIDTQIRITSSDAVSAAEWLDGRLDVIPDRVVMGTSTDGYGIDISALESDGYVIRNLAGEVALFAKTAAGLDRAVRKYAKTVESGAAVEDVTYHEGYRIKRLTIAGNDISEYTLVIPDDTDACTRTAAVYLSDYVSRSCGADLNTVSASDFTGGRAIYLTPGFEELGSEGFTITVDGDGDLHIDGGLWRGCLYGVFDLMEENVGWRFIGLGNGIGPAIFIPSDRQEYLLEAEHVDLTSEINRTETPDLPVIYGGTGWTQLQLKNTYATRSSPEAYGSYGFALYAVHGLQGNHNVIFSGDYEGLYEGCDKTGRQPCFTNEEILEAIDHFALEYVRTRLDAGQKIGKELLAVDVGQWDSGPSAFCQCKNCRKVEAVEGCHTGPVLRMANRVAALLDENYPGMRASILAYSGTDQLPAVTRPAKNLYVAYCFYLGEGYEGCQNHCISGVDCSTETGMTNKLPAKRFEEWAAVMDGSMIQVWMYPSNCANYCYNAPLYLTLLDNIRYLVSFGVGQIVVDSKWTNNGLINEELSLYLILHYVWDCSYTDEEALGLMKEWMQIVYGKDAGDLIFELTMLSERAGDRAGCWGSFNGHSRHRVDYSFISENAEMIWDTCERAVSLAEDTAGEVVIEKYLTGFLFLAMYSRYESMYVNGTPEEKAFITEKYRQVWDNFRRLGLPYNGGIGSFRYLRDDFDPDVNPEKMINDTLYDSDN